MRVRYRFQIEALRKAAQRHGDCDNRSIAARTGIGESQLSRYSRGISQPTYEVLARLGEPYEVSPDHLMAREPEPVAT